VTQLCNKETGTHAVKAPSSAPCCEEIRGILAVPFFKALCDPNRVAILAHLAESGAPRTVGDIAARLPIDVSVVSRHLAMLRDAGILTAERRGKAVYYAVRYAALAGTLRAMAETIDACCPAADGRQPGEMHHG